MRTVCVKKALDVSSVRSTASGINQKYILNIDDMTNTRP